MTVYNVYYMHPDWFGDGIFGKTPTIANLKTTHIFLRQVEANDLDDVYNQSQGEIWSPNGEAKYLLKKRGLQHTSMSVGDVIEDTTTGQFFVVSNFGFDRLAAKS